MSKPKLTPWFDGSVKPDRVGIYECPYGGFGQQTGYSKWNGKWWSPTMASMRYAARDRSKSFFQNRPWRGLASDPKAA